MQTKVLREIISIIRTEEGRRASTLPEGQDAALDRWLFDDEPFVSNLCLMFLVALRHQLERELLDLLARSGHHGKEISGKKYREILQKETLSDRTEWKQKI